MSDKSKKRSSDNIDPKQEIAAEGSAPKKASPVSGPSWSIGKNRNGERLAYVDDFKGTTYVSLREFYTTDDGQMKPGNKGISLTLEQFAKMRECWDAYCEAVEQVTKPGGGAKIPPTPNSPINGPSWLLGKNKSGERWVYVDDFKGTTYASVREYYTDKEGQLKPGKGISLSIEQFGALKGCWADLCAAVDDLKTKK